jgi:prephenate dehydrogenase
LAIRQITIIGTGLIGGSLGLALRKSGFRGTIVGCDRPAVLARAKKVGAIHRGHHLSRCQVMRALVRRRELDK